MLQLPLPLLSRRVNLNLLTLGRTSTSNAIKAHATIQAQAPSSSSSTTPIATCSSSSIIITPTLRITGKSSDRNTNTNRNINRYLNLNYTRSYEIHQIQTFPYPSHSHSYTRKPSLDQQRFIQTSCHPRKQSGSGSQSQSRSRSESEAGSKAGFKSDSSTAPPVQSQPPSQPYNPPRSSPFSSNSNSNSDSDSNPNSNPNNSSKTKTSPSLSLSLSLSLLGTTILSLSYLYDQYANDRLIQRNLLTFYVGALIAWDFKFNFDSSSPDTISAIHKRTADRILSLCESNAGLYVKLSQAIGTQAGILPKDYMKLSKLLDDASKMDWHVVRKVLEGELGGKEKVDKIFFSIDQEPIACASIAQVHHGYLRDPTTGLRGPECAIKIQRPEIRSYAANDLWCFRIMLKLHELTFGLPLSYFGGYITDQILQETDFSNELANTKRAKWEIENDKSREIRENCYVPKVWEEFSSSRILTMEFMGKPICKMTDRKQLENMGLNVRNVARSVMELSAAQIFDHGFVQADGHPGNVLVRPHPTSSAPGAHQIVLIDHGLYVTLSPEFKKQYAELWRAIFEVDLKTLKEIITSWGMQEDVGELFASATIMRPWKASKDGKKEEEKLYEVEADSNGEQIDDGKNGKFKISENGKVLKKWTELNEDERKKIRWEIERKRGMEFKEKINNFLTSVELVPKELIFVGRAMRIFQANNQALGSPVNRINILAKHASNALISTRTSSLHRVFFPQGATSSKSSTTSTSTSKSTSLSAPDGESIPPFFSRFSEWFNQRLAFLKFRFTLLLIDTVWETSNLLWLLRRTGVRTGQAIGLVKKDGKNSEQSERGFEDDLEEQMKKMANDELGIELNDASFSG